MILIFANTYHAAEYWAHEHRVKPSGWRRVRRLDDVRGYSACDIVIIEGTQLSESQQEALEHLRMMKATSE